jgi:hypothetical protein
MVDHDDDNIDTDTAGTDHGHPPPPADPVLIALQLCALANNKTVATAIKKLRRLDRQFADTQAKAAALAALAEQRNAALVQREAALDAREAAITEREDVFAASLNEARDNLRVYYNNIAEADRHIRFRVMSHAGLLGGFNPQLQDLPTWEQLRRLVVGLPEDLPAAPPTEVIRQENAREDWTGNVFVPGSTLTRSISKAAQ